MILPRWPWQSLTPSSPPAPEPAVDTAEALEWLSDLDDRIAAAVRPARTEGCACGRPMRCDPFAGVPVWPTPDAEWLDREDARLERLARLTRRYGPREAAMRVFGREWPGTRPHGTLPASPAASAHRDAPDPLNAPEAI